MWLLAGFSVVGGLVFVIFGTTELQPWAITAPVDLTCDGQDDHNNDDAIENT